MRLSEAGASRQDQRHSSVPREAATRALGRSRVGLPVSVIRKTTHFLTTLPAEVPPPVVVVESEDEIGLDWDEGAERVVSLTIDDSDRIGFAALFGREPHYGKAQLSDGPPEMVRYLLARLYPSARLR